MLKMLLHWSFKLDFMNYDQKKGQKSNWKFDSQPQIPRKQGSNEVQLGRAIHYWKYILEGYEISPLNSQKRLDLKYMNGQSFGTTIVPVLGLPLGSPEKK